MLLANISRGTIASITNDMASPMDRAADAVHTERPAHDWSCRVSVHHDAAPGTAGGGGAREEAARLPHMA